MEHAVPPRSEVPVDRTWNVESVFSSDQGWEDAVAALEARYPGLDRFRGRLGESSGMLADWFEAVAEVRRQLGKVYVYSHMRHDVDTADPIGTAMNDRARTLVAQVSAATAFAEPEIIARGFDTLRAWVSDEPGLAIYAHYFDALERRQAHVRSTEVEQLLGMVGDPFGTASDTHSVLTDTDLQFHPSRGTNGEQVAVAQGNMGALLTDPDRELRRTAWESYADAHVAMKNTMANCLSAGVKQHVFAARARGYPSALDAALEPNHIPTEVFHTLIETFRRNLPTWHRYWNIRRRALGYDTLHVYDIKAPLTAAAPRVSYEQAVEWIAEGMQPLGGEYVDVLRHGSTTGRWVDVMPNQHKSSGAYSTGAPSTQPFILMSFEDGLYGMSTLAHELGHSMHSYLAWKTQPIVYTRYGLFLAEVASNFNQAMVRAHLLQSNDDPDFQIAVIEEAMSNFHRYFFIMPTLARLELEIHQRVERGEGLTADGLITLMADLFAEGYGDEVEMDRERIGITWAEFSGHMYADFYVYQYATGISAATALAHGVLAEGPEAADRYLVMLKAGGSLYPLDALSMAGVDMATPEPVERAFEVLAQMVGRLDELVERRSGGHP